MPFCRLQRVKKLYRNVPNTYVVKNTHPRKGRAYVSYFFKCYMITTQKTHKKSSSILVYSYLIWHPVFCYPPASKALTTGRNSGGRRLKNYPDLHHSQGGLKFATQISPLLYYPEPRFFKILWGANWSFMKIVKKIIWCDFVKSLISSKNIILLLNCCH